MNVILHENVKYLRGERRKVSEHWTHIIAKNIMKEEFPEKCETLKSSKGLFHRFFTKESD